MGALLMAQLNPFGLARFKPYQAVNFMIGPTSKGIRLQGQYAWEQCWTVFSMVFPARNRCVRLEQNIMMTVDGTMGLEARLDASEQTFSQACSRSSAEYGAA